MKRIFSIAIAVLLGTFTSFAEQIKVTDIALVAGGSTTVEIELENVHTDLVAFQMDLTLPEGIGIDKEGCTLSSRISDEEQVLAIGRQSANTYRLTSTSFSLVPISGTSGALLTLKLTSTTDFVKGQATLTNILFSTASSQEVAASDVSFAINTLYTLTYMVDGEVYKNYTVAYGATVTPEAAPTKEGHTFSGWSEIPETMPANDVTVTGSFSANSYTLSYMVDGEVYKTYSVAYGKTLTPETAPEKEGHTFSGWSEMPETMPAMDVVVTGSFSINSYRLTYMVDGEEYKTYTVVYGTAITPEEEPAKEGYTFSGWSEIPETMPAKDVTVICTFSVNSYALTYMVDGEVYKTYSVAYGTALTPETAPEKEGYTFSGWSEMPETMPAMDVVVTGSFSINSYTLTYIVDGEVYNTYTVVYGTAITPEEEPTKEGYTFSGWSDIPATMPAKDVTVTGTFTINSYMLTYIVDGEEYQSFTVKYREAITPLEAPTKEGYTFSGWSEIPETMPANDVIVTGTFSVNSYTLTYKVDGEVYKTSSVPYGSKITPEVDLSKEGYTFSGWSEIPESMPAHDVVVTGAFIVNSYTLTYMVDDEVYQSFTIKYRDQITPLEAPTKKGYTFSGWDGLPRSMPAKDVIVKGYYIINSYTITYVLDGEIYTTETLEYGAKIVPPVVPGLEDYSIWEDVPETVPAKDITIYGRAKEIIDSIDSIHNSQFIIHNEEVYDLSGRKIDSSFFTLHSSFKRKGINIIRMSDGTIRKVLIK